MSSRARARLADGLRANLRAAGIPARPDHVERVIAEGCLDRALAFREALATLGEDGIPDHLAGWSIPEPGLVEAGDSSGLPRGAADQLDLAEQRVAGLHEPARSRAGEGQAAGPEGRKAPSAAGDRGPWPSTIAEAAPLVRARAISPVELTEQALARIEEDDGRANAFQLVMAERALAAARQAEDELAGGAWRGPLHGIPVAVKDLLAMTDTATTAGSKIFAGRVAGRDASAVEHLREAGAVIVGKTRLSEFAYWPGSTNPHYGPTPNPHDPARDAGGSSSGSAAAVARGMVYGALGSDTGGSIRIPAALCGVVGLKPTFGRASLFGCVPLAWSLDHLGPLASSVEDAALLLAAISGPDPRDGRTRSGRPFAASGAARGLDASPRAALRVGVPRELALNDPLEDAAARSWARANRALEESGATLVEVDLDDMSLLRQVAVLTLVVEAAAWHAPLLRAHYDDYGEFCRGRLLGAFTFAPEDFLGAQRLRHRIRERWNAILQSVDLLSLPCQPGVAPLLDMPASTDLTNPFNALGWPAISVPCGSGEGGLPLAVQLVAKPWDEVTLLRAARVIEG